MKNIRVIALVLILVMCVSLSGCRGTNRYLESGLGDDAADASASFSDNVTIAGQHVGSDASAAPETTAVPVVTAVPTAAPTATPAPTAAPTPTPTSSIYVVDTGVLTITKSPTSETVAEGGKASFVAYANNFAKMDWILVSPTLNADGVYQAYTALEAPNYFPGLVSTGTSSSTLILSNIPASLNGWRVQARFWASGSSTSQYTGAATIYVIGATPSPSPTPTPSSKATEAECRVYAENCRNYINTYASAKGYTVGAVEDFSYSDGLAGFSVQLSNSVCTIKGSFYATNDCEYGYYPAYAAVYNTQGAQISENIYGSTSDWQYFQSLIDSYATAE